MDEKDRQSLKESTSDAIENPHDLAEQEELTIGQVKKLTSGHFATPQGKRAEIKPILQCNKLPKVSENDEATWRKIKILDFKSTFVKPDNVKPDDVN